MDTFHEEVVIKRNQGMQQVMYILANVLMVLSLVYGLMMINVLFMVITSGGFTLALLPDALLVVFAVAACVLLFLYRDRIKKEYEYTFTNGILDFAAVYNNKKRKNLGSMQVKNVEACGLVRGQSFKRLANTPGVKMTNWFLNREAELFYFYFVKDNVRKIIVIEPSRDLQQMIRKYCGYGKYQED